MKVDGNRSYWGAEFDEDTDEKTNTLLGKNNELQKGGKDADETQGREEAIQIIQDPESNGRNAMQTLQAQKQAHGSGEDLSFPDANLIEEAMKDHDPNHMVPIYGDGSHTTPTKWWAALGGYGVCVPKRNSNTEIIEAKEEQQLLGRGHRTNW